MDSRNGGLGFFDILSIFSIALQVQCYNQDLISASNEDILKELQKIDREYLEKIVDNQNKILERLAALGADN